MPAISQDGPYREKGREARPYNLDSSQRRFGREPGWYPYDRYRNGRRFDRDRGARPYGRQPDESPENGNPDADQVPTSPVLSVSPTSVASGGSVTVNWDGGSEAINCAVYLSDAGRTNYQPWPSSVTNTARIDGITSSTILSMTCIGEGGAYLPGPTPTATITVN
jgi:hypothetical protein